jgi:PST family polysaccharide transporter
MANFLLPLLAFPYFLRVLTDSQIGILALSTTINAYFIVVTDFGFNISATQDVAKNHTDLRLLNRIFSSVVYIKMILLAILFCGLFVTIKIFNLENGWFFILNFLTVIGTTLFPLWFLQGLGKIHFFTTTNIVIRSTFVLCTIFFVKNSYDFYLIPLLNGIGFILSSTIGILYIFKKLKIRIERFSYQIVIERIKSSLDIFYTRILVSLYTSSNIIILGSFTNPVIVAKYAVIDKFIFLSGAVFEPINQILFPKLIQLNKSSISTFNRVVNNYFAFTVIFGIVSIFSILIMGKYLILIITGNYNQALLTLLYKSLLIIILIPFGPFLSNLLVIKELNKELLKVIKLTVVVDFLLVPISIWKFSLEGLFYSYFVVLLLHVVYLYIVFRKNYEEFDFRIYK